MKKISTLVLSLVLLFSVLSGCAGSPGGNSAGSADKTKLTVYTSFYPVYDFTKKIGGDKIKVTNMIPAGTEPHDWEPTATDVANLEKADLFIYSGAGMEHWVDKVLGTLESKKLVSVEACSGIHLLAGHADEEDGEASAYDPHVWTSVKNAKQEMENIKDALVKADAANKDYYENNYNTYAAQFDELDNTFKTTLAALPNKNIVVAHQAFGYLCAEYGLTQVPIEGLSADSEPDPAKMSEILQFAKENNVKTIFFEELVSPKVAETIAAELGVKTDMLNPLEGLTEAQINAGEDYISVMKQNLDSLKKALQ